MKEKRSTLNRILFSLYILWYLLIPAVFLGLLHGTIDMPFYLVWCSWFAGFGIIFFVLGGFVLIIESFPRSNQKAFLLFVPIIVNHATYLILHGTGSLLKIMTTNASITFSALIFAVCIAAVFQPWHNQENQNLSGVNLLIASWKNKFRYIKNQPAVLAGFGVLLLPVFSAFYYTAAGGIISISSENNTAYLKDTALYVFSIINVTVFHYREFRKYFTMK